MSSGCSTGSTQGSVENKEGLNDVWEMKIL